MGVFSYVPFVGSTFAHLFEKYQANEDLRTADEAWKDLFGALIGFGIGSFVILLALIWALATYLPLLFH